MVDVVGGAEAAPAACSHGAQGQRYLARTVVKKAAAFEVLGQHLDVGCRLACARVAFLLMGMEIQVGLAIK